MPRKENAGPAIVPNTTSIAELAREFPAPTIRPKSYLEMTGTLQMSALLGTIAVISIALLIHWWCTQPGMEDVAKLMCPQQTSLQPVDAEKSVELWIKLQDAHTEQASRIFQMVVLSGLVPLFTLLAGYVFGKNQAVFSSKDENEKEL